MMPSTTNGADLNQQQQQQLWMQQQQIQQQQQIHHQQQQQQIQGSSDENRTIWIGDLQQWMDEGYINTCFAHTGEVNSVKVIRSKQTSQSEGYGFIEFLSHAAAEKVLQSFNGTTMPNTEQTFRLNWATFSAGAAPPARVGRKQRKLKGPEAAARIPTVTHLLM
ncbi:polyadenylate-binding protein RBP47-like [Camellia sinensis]|nr:polyadenylate-binding protein RBP47-like [Camellia sinensis]